jgi:hypothetical protein
VGDPFRGDRLYWLHIPAGVPAIHGWAVTVYDAETSCFVRDAPRVAVDSHGEKLYRNADGSIELYVGPKAPPGKESNWIYIKPGKHWFALFRVDGLDHHLLEKGWKLMDFEKVHVQ